MGQCPTHVWLVYSSCWYSLLLLDIHSSLTRTPPHFYVNNNPPVAKAASCDISGPITSDTTWNPATCAPYIVTGDITVNENTTLTIEAGTTVKFDTGLALTVNGTLKVLGTENSLVTFTSNSADPAPGDWGYIFFSESSTDATYDDNGTYTGGSIVQYAVVEYGGASDQEEDIYSTLSIEASSPYIDHTTVRNNAYAGIRGVYINDLRLTNNNIMDNPEGSINIGFSADGNIFLSGNTITRNGSGTGGINLAYQGCEGKHTITLVGNTIVNNVGEGISIYSCGDTTNILTDNTITGNSALYGGIYLSFGINTLTGNTITGTEANSSIYLWGGTTTLTGNTITSNMTDYYGVIYLTREATAAINNNSIYDNEGNAIYNNNPASEPDVNAQSNWWGTTDATAIEDLIYHQTDDSTLGKVDYSNFLTAPPSEEATPTPTVEPSTPTPTTPTSTPTAGSTRNLTINHGTGKPGSRFVIHGNNFVGISNVNVSVNGQSVASISISNNSFTLSIVTSSSAQVGTYRVSITSSSRLAADDEALSTMYVLDADAPLREEQPDDATAVDVPETIPPLAIQAVYLPLITR